MEDHELPETAEKLVAQGKAFYNEGDFASAIAEFTEAIRLEPDIEKEAEQTEKESGPGYYGWGSVYGQLNGISWKLH
jgi:tetratricopeptide (TPR) repeat protein